MADKKPVSTNTNVETKTTTEADGTVIKVITTTTVEKYADGSTQTKTHVQTITEGFKKPEGADGDNVKEWKPISDPSKIPKDPLTTDDKFLKDALNLHNDYRKKHGADKLELDKDLCKVAQAWANTIAKKGNLAHSSNGYGENVYWDSGTINEGKVPVEAWYAEMKDFDFDKVDHQRGTGHFTQVVWKGSKRLGIAKAHDKDGSSYVVANYDPPGNFLGQYAQNVSKKK